MRAAIRLLRALRVFSVIFLSYLWMMSWERLWPKRYAKKERRSRIHRRNARRMYKGFVSLRGVYIKLGQILSIMGTFLPKEYTEELEGLQDEVPPQPYKTISKSFVQAFGKHPTEGDNWKIIQEYAPARLEALESIEDFYPCSYYSDKYYPQFKENMEDCEVITTTLSRMKWGKCDDNDPKLKEVNAAYMSKCYEAPTAGAPSCNELLRNGRYRDAVKCLEDALPNISNSSDKAKYNYLLAQIYFAYLKNFPKARQYAREASRLRPNWGEPYILVGLLYASSGPICGPGRGWDSQVVVWPAIDEWYKAKSVDPSVAGKANKYIGQYSQYMPDKGELFQRLKKEGDSYFVGCWIQETTTIRAKP